LLVTIEAASPGEYKSGGAGLTITWGLAESPFGWCNLAWNARGLCNLSFQESAKVANAPAELRENWPAATLVRDDAAARRQAENIFHRPGKSTRGLKALVRGTPFQLKVWRALLRIPEGGLASYGAIAAWIGQPKATRAVGSACGANPVAYLIPCHRVIRETGVVRGYRWGTVRKQALLACEAAQCVMK
jgi:AraC family transcriptional regulator of adaptative response/methylated-DNA-[protein]-cysteine methyltransferase